jgi:hypothetical protein
MRRRALLRGGVAALGTAALPFAGAATGPTDDAYRPLGRVDVSGTAEVVVREETAFLATRDGFAVVDVSDPAAPALLTRVRDVGADREGGPLRDVLDVALLGEDRLVVAGPDTPVADGLRGVAVFDVGDPADPSLAAFLETEHAVHNVRAAGGHLYFPATGSVTERLVVADATGGDLAVVGDWALSRQRPEWSLVDPSLYQLHDLWVDADRGVAYLAQWDAGVTVLDVSDPGAPTLVGRFGGVDRERLAAVTDEGPRAVAGEGLQPPGNVHSTTTDPGGDLLAVGRESWDLDPDDDRGGPSGVELYDVADPGEPERLARIAPLPGDDQTRDGRFTTAHNLTLTGDRLYAAWYHGGVTVHDVSDPAAPERLTWWQRPGDAVLWAARPLGSDALVASDRGTGPPYDDAGLYVFPDVPTDETPATARVATPTPSPAPSPTRTSTPSATTTPGPGVAGAAVALAAAAWRRLRRPEGLGGPGSKRE